VTLVPGQQGWSRNNILRGGWARCWHADQHGTPEVREPQCDLSCSPDTTNDRAREPASAGQPSQLVLVVSGTGPRLSLTGNSQPMRFGFPRSSSERGMCASPMWAIFRRLARQSRLADAPGRVRVTAVRYSWEPAPWPAASAPSGLHGHQVHLGSGREVPFPTTAPRRRLRRRARAPSASCVLPRCRPLSPPGARTTRAVLAAGPRPHPDRIGRPRVSSHAHEHGVMPPGYPAPHLF
jgi:hypothetical protein